MTQDEIIEMARQVGYNSFEALKWKQTLTDFAKLVAAHRYQEGYEAGRDAGRAEQQADMESLYAMYQQACQQRDLLMEQQRAQVAAMRGQIQ